jgi:Mannosyltransferase (PIG-V)
MSATSPGIGHRRTSLSGRLGRMAVACPVPVRAFFVSRLIVLGAGVAGALAVPRRIGWSTFDPLGLSARLGSVGDVLAAPAVRWDSIHYLGIAEHGYAAAGNTAFFPLYPLLMRALGFVLGSDPLAGVAISTASFMVALSLLHRLTELELGRRAADATVLLLAFAPLSFFFTAVYTESLFLALSLGAVYAARRERWALAAGVGGLAAVTHVTGILLVIPVAAMYLAERRRRRRWSGLGWFLVMPAALAGYLGYLAIRGYGALAPLTQQTGAEHGHRLTGPIETSVAAVRAAAAGLRSLGAGPIYQPTLGGPFPAGTESIVLLAVLAIAVLALVAAFRRLPLAYVAYAGAALLVCTWSPVAGQPLKSLDRYALTIFPLWMGAGAWISERRMGRATLLVSVALLAFWTLQFATWTWVA